MAPAGAPVERKAAAVRSFLMIAIVLAAYWLVDELTNDEIFRPDMDKQR
jgi:hypothetical protein